MIASSALALALQLAAAPASTSPTLTADLDGGGGLQTVTAVTRGKEVRLEIRGAGGKLLAESVLPGTASAGTRVTLTTGSLGSSGALVAAAAAGDGVECRSLWRYRDGRLLRIPVIGSAGPLPECAPPEWSYRWKRPGQDVPAVYARERSRQRPNGLFREVEVFRYAGFRLELDRGSSTVWINGVEIPAWRDAVFYPREAVDRLASRFDLSLFRAKARLRFLADRMDGVFDLRVEEGSRQLRFPVTAAALGEKKREMVLTAGSPGARVRLLLSGDGSIPLEASVHGLGEALDQTYVPVMRERESGVRVYDSAEQELAEEYLPGTWDSGKDQVTVTLLSPSPVLVRFGKSEASISVARAPRGVDVLLLPRDGSLPVLGLLLRGANAIVEVPVHCEPAGDPGEARCESGEPGRTLHRVGVRLNLR